MSNKLLVTWIAPVIPDLEQLAWLNELGRIQKIAGVQVLSCTGGDLTLDDVAAVLREPCDLLVWSGHGTPGGLLLPDHTLVRVKWLAAQVARGCRPRVVILAACGSQLRDENLRSLTETICRGGVNAIGFPATAGDMAAGHFTIEYIRALAVNASIVQAFDVALEAIAETPTAAGVFLTPGIVDVPFFLEDQLRNMTDGLNRIEMRLGIHREAPMVSTDVPGPSDKRALEGGIQSLSRDGHIRGLKADVAKRDGAG